MKKVSLVAMSLCACAAARQPQSKPPPPPGPAAGWDRCWQITATHRTDHPQGRHLEGVGFEGYSFHGNPDATQAGKASLHGHSVCDFADETRRPGADSVSVTADFDVQIKCGDHSFGVRQCIVTSASRELCGFRKNREVPVALVDGFWSRTAVHYRPGEKGVPADTYTLACATSAIEKCADFWRYDPVALPDQFDSCIRMSRADYCGWGLSFTLENTVVDAFDPAPLETSCFQPGNTRPSCSSGACEEAEWSTGGATCLRHLRHDSFSEKDFPGLTNKLGECNRQFENVGGATGERCRKEAGMPMIGNRSKVDGCKDCAQSDWDGACKNICSLPSRR